MGGIVGKAGRDLCAAKIARGKVARSSALLILGRFLFFFSVVCCVEGKTRAGFVVFKGMLHFCTALNCCVAFYTHAKWEMTFCLI